MKLIIFVLLAELQIGTIGFAQGNKKAAALFNRAQEEDVHVSSRAMALAHIDQALTIEPRNAQFWQQKAVILAAMEEQEQALPCIEKAVELDPKSGSVWETKAFILNGLNKNPEALRALDEAVRLDGPKSYRRTKIDILMHMSLFAQAEKVLDDCIKENPNNPELRDRRAQVAAHVNHWDKVIEDRTFLLKSLGPKSYKYYGELDNRATAYVHIKQYDKAIADYKTGLKANPDDRKLHSGLLNVYKITSNKKEADVERAALENLDDDIKPFK